MKKTFLVLAIMALVLAGCGDGAGGGTGEVDDETPPATILTIRNMSSYSFDFMSYENTVFSYEDEGGLYFGESMSKELITSTDCFSYILFEFTYYAEDGSVSGCLCRTQEAVSVPYRETVIFTFTDNTVVVEVSNTSNVGTLGTFIPSRAGT
jgi:hypothetical protein